MLIEGAWKECHECKGKLVSARYVLYKRKIIKAFFISAVFLSPVIASYIIQVEEREDYKQSIQYLLKGEYSNSKKLFEKAFSANPAYVFFKEKLSKLKNSILSWDKTE